MDLARVGFERRPPEDLGPVERVAVGRGPDAVLRAGCGEVLAAKGVQERRVGGIDLVPDDGANRLAILVPCHLHEGRHDRILDRRREHSLDLGDRALGDDPGRRQAAGQRLTQQLPVVGHVLRVRVEAGEEQLQPLRRVGRLELAELGQQRLRAAHLVDDLERVDPLVIEDDEDLADHAQDVARDPVLDIEALVRDRGCGVAHVLGEAASVGAADRARVRQAIVEARVAIDRRADRVERLEALPEAVGELVDGGRLGQPRASVRSAPGMRPRCPGPGRLRVSRSPLRIARAAPRGAR